MPFSIIFRSDCVDVLFSALVFNVIYFHAIVYSDILLGTGQPQSQSRTYLSTHNTPLMHDFFVLTHYL